MLTCLLKWYQTISNTKKNKKNIHRECNNNCKCLKNIEIGLKRQIELDWWVWELTLWSFWSGFTKAMKGYVTTALNSFIGQSLFNLTQRADIFLATEHQSRIAFVSWFFKSTVKRKRISISLKQWSIFRRL